jgi:molybdopterin/thiamine biosynthesis adenylyltransferase
VTLFIFSKKDKITSDESLRLEEFFVSSESKTISIEEVENISRNTGIPLRRVECFALGKGLIPIRYQRNIGTFGIEGQIKLLRSSVMIIGLGGLGGGVLEQIARAGFGTIIGVDPDVFDQSNLNRQLLSTEHTIGEQKAASAKKRVHEINSAVSFMGHVCRFQDLPDGLWQEVDIVFDCLDNIPDRLILADKCAHADCTLIHGAIAGWYAEVGVVWPGSKMLERYYQGQIEGIEKELGTPASTAMMTASIMAAKAVHVLAGSDLNKESKMYVFNLLDNEWQTITM